MVENTIKIGLLGCGTVGGAVYDWVLKNNKMIKSRTGLQLEITRIFVRHVADSRYARIPQELLTENVNDILDNPEISIVIEVLGGIEPASSYMLQAMKHGKHVVTANKAALAANYQKLTTTARENKVMLRFEAAVAGGIPILNAIQAPLMANEINKITGIVNGTTNYILTQMAKNGLDYATALQQAQKLGFAESDPTADVTGIDVANKLTILIALAFGENVRPADLPRIGIEKITKEDIVLADKLGYCIKLIATAKQQNQRLQAFVAPTLIAKGHLLSSVANEMNAVVLRGNIVGNLLFYGAGAGGAPTASAVLGDVIEISNAMTKGTAYDNHFNQLSTSKLEFVGKGVNSYYLRLAVQDKSVIQDQIADVFDKAGLEIRSVYQEEADGKQAELIFILNETKRNKLNRLLVELKSSQLVHDVISLMPIIEEE